MRMRRLTMLWAAYRGSCHRARRLRATACRGRAPPRAIPRRRRPWISSSTRRAGRSRSRPWRGRRRWGRNWAAWAGTRRIPGTPPSPPPPPPSLPPSLSFLRLRPTNRSIDQYPIYLYQSKKKAPILRGVPTNPRGGRGGGDEGGGQEGGGGGGWLPGDASSGAVLIPFFFLFCAWINIIRVDWGKVGGGRGTHQVARGRAVRGRDGRHGSVGPAGLGILFPRFLYRNGGRADGVRGRGRGCAGG